MFSSLFGDLGARKEAGNRPPEKEPERGFSATAISESVDAEINARGLIVDRHSSDLVVTGSPALAIREHFAASRSDLETASRQITMYDPANAWAGAVIKALSDAAGSPIDRLHLRESSTLRSLATIERTVLTRRKEDPLKIYNVEVRAPGPENAEIPVTLMESSHLAAVIIGPMQPHAIDATLTALFEATCRRTWRCPSVLFILPPSAVWIANKIIATEWPTQLQVQVLNESLNSASAVWNALLGIWNHVKSRPDWDTPAASGPAVRVGFPTEAIGVAQSPTSPEAAGGEPRGQSRHGRNPVSQRTARILAEMGSVPGLLGCAVVDFASGMVLARQVPDSQALDLELAAIASSQVLRSHRLAAHNMGLPERVDEIMTSAGSRLHVLRTVSQHPELLLFALLDKQNTDLSLARSKLTEAEQSLV